MDSFYDHIHFCELVVRHVTKKLIAINIAQHNRVVIMSIRKLLELATISGYKELCNPFFRVAVEELVKANATDNPGNNAPIMLMIHSLLLASEFGYEEIVEILIGANPRNGISGANVDINSASEMGATALMMASNNGHEKIVEMLLKEGANINAADNIGNTALMCAAMFRTYWYHNEMYDALVSQGAVENAAFRDKWRTLIMEDLNNYSKTIKILIAAGADLEMRNNRGQTARDLCLCRGHGPVHDYMIQNFTPRCKMIKAASIPN